MKKLNIRPKVILWMIFLFCGIVGIILCSIIIHNSKYVIATSKIITIPTSYVNQALYEQAISIGLLVLSIIVTIIGSYITYAGIKSWKYNAVA